MCLVGDHDAHSRMNTGFDLQNARSCSGTDVCRRIFGLILFFIGIGLNVVSEKLFSAGLF